MNAILREGLRPKDGKIFLFTERAAGVHVAELIADFHRVIRGTKPIPADRITSLGEFDAWGDKPSEWEYFVGSRSGQSDGAILREYAAAKKFRIQMDQLTADTSPVTRQKLLHEYFRQLGLEVISTTLPRSGSSHPANLQSAPAVCGRLKRMNGAKL